MRAVSRRQEARARRFARPLLVHDFGAEAAGEVERRVAGEYVTVAGAVPVLRSPMSRMTLRLAVDALVLDRALPDELPRAGKLELISRFVSRWMDGQFDTAVSRWGYARRGPHLLFRRFWFSTANILDEPDGWRFRFRRGEPGLFYGVDVTRCGIVRFLVDQGPPELAPLLCQGDFRITRYLPTGVAFERTQVIAEGAPFCGFRYREAR
ncbi:L-2-amino-thiazoline-4-carboxylic acid hydrolase [Amycolatopsis coloradensis]|uniref:L-2-amino-thiazoline-4-carboxylic acid hydrolase n=1 Tax=Amycolatopsis coloradensis TaxID=76021 RepID=A0ACD5BG49_9PSEU